MSAFRDALRSLPDAVFADLLEGDDAYLLVLDLPGVTSETLDVRVDGNRLAVEAKRRKDVPQAFTYRTEERSLFLDVELPLPPDATGEASATIDRGVLEVRLPRRPTGTHSVPIEG